MVAHWCVYNSVLLGRSCDETPGVGMISDNNRGSLPEQYTLPQASHGQANSCFPETVLKGGIASCIGYAVLSHGSLKEILSLFFRWPNIQSQKSNYNDHGKGSGDTQQGKDAL
jgi:hypothetical protein